MRVLPDKDVYLVLACWKVVCDKYDVTFVEDLKAGVRLAKCVQSYVDGWAGWDVVQKANWLENYLEWIIVSGKRFSSAWRWVVQYIDSISVEEGVREVVEAYKKYVKEKFGKVVDVDMTKKEVIVASRVLRKVAMDFGITVEDVIRYQHECWEKIDRPLVFERMANEGRVKRRIEVYLREKKRAGEVVTKNGSVGDDKRKEIEEVWKNVLRVGLEFYAKKNGFIGEVARECVERMKEAKNTVEKLKVLREYSPEKVYDKWVKKGKPSLVVD